MALTRTDENELLTALHGNMMSDRPWHLFLNRLRARIEADCCCLWAKREISEWTCIDIATSGNAFQIKENISIPSFDAMRPNRIYRQDELAGDGDRNVGDIGDSRHILVSQKNGCDAVLSAYMARSEFRSSDAALLLNLTPHLSIALRLYDEFLRQRLKNAQADRALAEMATGWLLLDGQGRVLESSALADAMIEERRVLHLAGDGRLRCIAPSAEAVLETAIADPLSLPRAAWLGTKPLVQMVATYPAGDINPATTSARCLILVRKVREPMMKDGRYLEDLFNLTRSEALLAARIAEGESIAQAAAALSLTIETARNYSKRIYAKTRTRGQADLARVLLGGVSMLG